VRDALEAIRRDENDRKAWATLAMMLGDTRAAPLCFLVCYHASILGDPSDADGARIGSHMALACCDLGLATWDGDKLVFDYPAGLAWISNELSPFELEPPGDGDSWRADGTRAPRELSARAAWFCLGLAALRTEVVSHPPREFDPSELEEAGLARAVAAVIAGVRADPLQ
jgi:hypothetical protein